MAEKKTEKNEEGEGAESEAAPKGKSKKKLIMILVPVILLLIGVVAFFLIGGSEEPPKGGEETEEGAEESSHTKKLATLKIEPLIVNLSENISFLKVTMIIEYDPEIFAKADKGHAHREAHGGGGAGGGDKKEEGAGVPAHFTTRQPMIRDAIIRVLSSKKVADVITTEGKEKLKEVLIEAINDAIGLPDNPVVNVYFLDFIIQ